MNIRKPRMFITVFFCLCAIGGAGGYTVFEKILESGNQAYKEKRYQDAIASYTRILEEGYENGNLYYNIGNSYFKSGNVGEAVFYYVKAATFIPADNDLNSNYEYALSLLDVDSFRSYGSWPVRIVNKTFAIFGLNSLTVFATILYTALVLLLIARLFTRRFKRFFIAAFVLLGLVFALSGYALFLRFEHVNKGAIVISQGAQARFEPFESATVHYEPGEGSYVRIIEKSGEWFKIRRFDGKLGWVRRLAVKPLFP